MSAQKSGLCVEIQCAMQKLRDETYTEASMFSFQDAERKLIISAYGRDPNKLFLSDLRVHLYPRKKELKALPPTEGVFVEYCERSYYQLAIWNASLVARPCLPSPLSY